MACSGTLRFLVLHFSRQLLPPRPSVGATAAVVACDSALRRVASHDTNAIAFFERFEISSRNEAQSFIESFRSHILRVSSTFPIWT